MSVVAEKRSMVRTRTFTGQSVEDVCALMKRERLTGRIIIDMSQGGVSSVQAEDRRELSDLTPHEN